VCQRLDSITVTALNQRHDSQASPLVCYVTDRRAFPPPSPCSASTQLGWASHLLDAIARAAEAGVDAIQLREKDLTGKVLLDLATAANARAEGKLIINDRLDVALAAGAAGVHLGGGSVPVSAVTRLRGTGGGRALPEGFLVGRSCHSLEEAQEAERAGADYIYFGPVFPTPSKARFGPPQGVSALQAVCRSVRIPVFAIGGITLENAGTCVAAGAAGLAAIRLFQEAVDLAAILRAIKQQ
jgi:thiamine-phosphate pyrophosphorylase